MGSPLTRPRNLILMVNATLYSCMFLYWYPLLPGIEDEYGFLNQALLWAKGSISAEGAGLTEVFDFVESGGRHVSVRNPGRSLLILPFVLGGSTDSAFLSGLLIHLSVFLTAIILLSRAGLSPLWALLYLWHPTLVIYSRTIMSDAVAGLLLMMAILAVRSPKRVGIKMGTILSLAVLCRYHLAVVVPFFIMAMWFDTSLPNNRRHALVALAILSLSGILIIGYNWWLYQSLTGPKLEGGMFSSRYVWAKAWFYLTALMVIWPLSLGSLLFDRSIYRRYTFSSFLPVLGLLCFYYFHDQGSSLMEMYVIGQRLIQPGICVLLLSYAFMLSRWFSLDWHAQRLRTALIAVVLLVVIVLNGAIFHRHQNHLNDLVAAKQEFINRVPPGSDVLANSSLQKLFGILSEESPYQFQVVNYQETILFPQKPISSEQSYIALLLKHSAVELPEKVRLTFSPHYRLEDLPSSHPRLKLFRISPLR